MSQYRVQRRHERENYEAPLDFTVLLTQFSELKRIATSGRTVDKSPAGIGIVTEFPLEAGHVLQWDDEHKRGNLHMAVVKWAQKIDNRYRAGLFLI